MHLNRAEEGIRRIAKRLRTMNTHYGRALSSPIIPKWAANIQCKVEEVLGPDSQVVDSAMPPATAEDPTRRRTRKASKATSTNPTAASSSEPPPLEAPSKRASKQTSAPSKRANKQAQPALPASSASSALPASESRPPMPAVPIAAAPPRVFDDLASIPPSRFYSNDHLSFGIPALNENGVISGIAPPAAPKLETSMHQPVVPQIRRLQPLDSAASLSPAGDEAEAAPAPAYRPAPIERTGFTTRRGA